MRIYYKFFFVLMLVGCHDTQQEYRNVQFTIYDATKYEASLYDADTSIYGVEEFLGSADSLYITLDGKITDSIQFSVYNYYDSLTQKYVYTDQIRRRTPFGGPQKWLEVEHPTWRFNYTLAQHTSARRYRFMYIQIGTVRAFRGDDSNIVNVIVSKTPIKYH